jgi:predicted adenine nucleotide alpha hydrolase (AANH) superfamily ATPase
MIEGDFDYDGWKKYVAGFEAEKERGERCSLCFKMRLLASAKLASENNIALFTTSLAASRWKDIEQIKQAGQWAAAHFENVHFWDKNWRKDGLSEKRRELLQKNAFYNQQYCGCEFSKRR